jgi:mitochondrial import receptor subunit TOM40
VISTDTFVCLQVATTGIVSLTYHQRINEKGSVAADFLYNWQQPSEAVASVGYDYQFRQCRLRGSVDSNGKVAALLEEALAPGVRLVLSGELDHYRSDHKFGFGMTMGE